MCFKYIYIYLMPESNNAIPESSSIENYYYLAPDFKYGSIFVLIIILAPFGIMMRYIVKNEGFQNKSLENDIIEEHEEDMPEITEIEDSDDWDITEYISDKFNIFKNYIKKLAVINNENGSKSINVRYNIE